MITILIKNEIGIKEINSDFGLELSSDITFDTAFEYEKTDITVRREVIPESMLYSPMPWGPKLLVTNIFNIKPIAFPKMPPINKIKVDLKNVLFLILFNILNYMFTIHKIML